ncbi:transmembrane protein 275-like [Gadus chalcogrammus]|uniref:transmembrane protein 275-like n=1 Tax=Gadus chalcogrammus TaxID=1042646 RepID=UPI0024C4B60D|nr:transmembrane protein 275-like [Gadus chalcogrammus]
MAPDDPLSSKPPLGTPTAPAQNRLPKKRATRPPHNLPSPALCCACGLCVTLAGVNITLVGAFAFGTLLPSNNPPIIIGPLLLLVALAFFTTCCVFSRRSARPATSVGAAGCDSSSGLMMMKMGGAVAFEMETSEHTLPDTIAVQLSPTDSLTSSSPIQEEHPALGATTGTAHGLSVPSRYGMMRTGDGEEVRPVAAQGLECASELSGPSEEARWS